MITRKYPIYISKRNTPLWETMKDIANIITTHKIGLQIIGGLMVELHTHAYPTTNFIERSTTDTDIGITTELAATGNIHNYLTNMGYKNISSNSYQKNQQKIDILVPGYTRNFAPKTLSGRAFDAIPGLDIILNQPPTHHHIQLTTPEQKTTQIIIPTPNIESAIILKASTTQTRNNPNDIFDLYNLFTIKNNYTDKEIGGWRLNETNPKGIQLDGIRALEKLLKTKKLTGIEPYLNMKQFKKIITQNITRQQ